MNQNDDYKNILKKYNDYNYEDVYKRVLAEIEKEDNERNFLIHKQKQENYIKAQKLLIELSELLTNGWRKIHEDVKKLWSDKK